MNRAESAIVNDAVESSPDHKTRKIILVLACLALLGFIVAFVAGWIAWSEKQQQVNAGANLAEQVELACENDELNTDDLERLCQQASDVDEKIDSVEVPGIPGIQGPRGEQGFTGPQGPMGPIGPRGYTGKDGPDGKDGAKGSDGAVGLSGEDGMPGDPGSPGDQGDQGPPGPPGSDGRDGAEGPEGPRGEQGDAGYPESWSYTVPGPGGSPGVTYYCSDPDGDHNYTCEPQ